MATVRMTLTAAGLLVYGTVCGMAFAGGPAGTATTVADQSESSGSVKPKAAGSSPVSKKKAKAFTAPKADAKGAPASGRMQVVEPKAAAPANPARESKDWQKSHARGLTDAQKQAFRERKENMEGMIAVIKEKRKALQDAKPEERAALARELHSLILEKDPVANSSTTTSTTATTARVGTVAPDNARSPDKPVPEAKSAGQASRREDEKKAEAAEQRRKRIEAHQEQLRKKEEIRKQQLERHKSSLENSQAPVGGLSQGIEED